MIETKFKDTEVGRIPEDWELDKLKDKFEFRSNNTLSRDALSESGIIQDVHYGDVLIKYGSHLDVQKDEVPYITDKNYKASVYISDGDVIMADTAEDETVGKATEVINVGHHQLVSGLHTMWLHPIVQERYALGYLGYAFNANVYHNQLLPLMQGTKVTSVSKTAVKDTSILVPPKSEQTRIARALSNIDALISELGKLIEKKRVIKQGAMQQLLTGKKRIKGFSEPWIEKKLGEDATILRGGSPRPIEDYITDSQDGLNWIKIGDVKPDDKYFRKTAEKIKKEGLTKTRQVKKGDFILSNSMSFGRPYILDIDGCIHDGWLVIQDYQETYDMQFLYYVLCSDGVKDQYIAMAAGSSVQNLNKEKVANVILNAPASLEEQSAIASVLSSMDEEISSLEAKREKYTSIKQGMMQQLLTGKIRLID
ncbi:MAG: restriction endonuclease subunit S [Prevotellaceae bacterium]|nr:restriction endonuclease subunit S [Prevotellaceae bacterium]